MLIDFLVEIATLTMLFLAVMICFGFFFDKLPVPLVERVRSKVKKTELDHKAVLNAQRIRGEPFYRNLKQEEEFNVQVSPSFRGEKLVTPPVADRPSLFGQVSDVFEQSLEKNHNVSGEQLIQESRQMSFDGFSEADQILGFDKENFEKTIEHYINKANDIAGHIEVTDFLPGQEYFQYNHDLWLRTKHAGIMYNLASEFVQSTIDDLRQIQPQKLRLEHVKELDELLSPNGLMKVRDILDNNAAIMFRKNLKFRDLIGQECGKGGAVWAKKLIEGKKSYVRY